MSATFVAPEIGRGLQPGVCGLDRFVSWLFAFVGRSAGS